MLNILHNNVKVKLLNFSYRNAELEKQLQKAEDELHIWKKDDDDALRKRYIQTE